MSRIFTAFVASLLLAAVAHGDNSGLVTYNEFLAVRGLSQAQVDCKNPKTEDVLFVRIQDWDRGQTVCEVWIKEKVTREQPLTFKDGSQVYMTMRRWTAPKSMPPQQVEVSDSFVVKEDTKPETHSKAYKRYVAKQEP